MSVKDEILSDLETKLVDLGNKFSDYVNNELFTKQVEIDNDEEPEIDNDENEN